MNEHDATEQAYKNGYSAGYAAGRRFAGQIMGEWIPRNPHDKDSNHYCSNCKQDISAIKALYYKYCPECGAYMRGKKNGTTKD